tara:strand:- start:69 stop:329 length:261 start_codon:yes stop_codon:yes gene_type:complete
MNPTGLCFVKKRISSFDNCNPAQPKTAAFIGLCAVFRWRSWAYHKAWNFVCPQYGAFRARLRLIREWANLHAMKNATSFNGFRPHK